VEGSQTVREGVLNNIAELNIQSAPLRKESSWMRKLLEEMLAMESTG
jgi:hypothetical protein